MIEAIMSGLHGLGSGFAALQWHNLVMIVVGCGLLLLAIRKTVEPLLLVPIGFGAILVNIPLAGLMEESGFLRTIYNMGVHTELFPLLIFIGIGAMTDFGPLLENPRIFLLGAAGQFGIFMTVALALFCGFGKVDAAAIGIIGACDGPTAIFFASRHAPDLLAAVSVAAYSYMSLVPVIQPPIIRLLTTDRERAINMTAGNRARPVSRAAKIAFPVVVTLFGGLIAPLGLPLLGTIMLGNLMRECGVVERLVKASENEIASTVTLLLGIAVGATMDGARFLTTQTILILAFGFAAICLDTVCGVLFGKLMCWLSGGKVNPIIGAAGISAYPMAARVAQTEGLKYNKQNFLLMHAVGVNTGGQIGSVMAAAIMMSILKGMGLI